MCMVNTWFVAIMFSSSSILFLRAESVVPVFDSVTVPCGDLKVGRVPYLLKIFSPFGSL